MRKITLLIFIIIISLLINKISVAEGPKNYLKGKFYSSVKDHFLIATKKMNDNNFKKTGMLTPNEFMKAGDYNPPHTHGADFSFVLYLDIPEDMLDEEKKYKGVGTGPGAIAFYYGEWQKLVRTEHHFMPEKGMMFIFPGKLRHSVPPFKSPGTRVSVSGNIELLGEVSFKGW